jgi:hypothetical protein
MESGIPSFAVVFGIVLVTVVGSHHFGKICRCLWVRVHMERTASALLLDRVQSATEGQRGDSRSVKAVLEALKEKYFVSARGALGAIDGLHRSARLEAEAVVTSAAEVSLQGEALLTRLSELAHSLAKDPQLAETCAIPPLHIVETAQTLMEQLREVDTELDCLRLSVTQARVQREQCARQVDLERDMLQEHVRSLHTLTDSLRQELDILRGVNCETVDTLGRSVLDHSHGARSDLYALYKEVLQDLSALQGNQMEVERALADVKGVAKGSATPGTSSIGSLAVKIGALSNALPPAAHGIRYRPLPNEGERDPALVSTPESTEEAAVAVLRPHLVAFYRLHNPSRIATVDQVLEEYRGRERELIYSLEAKYNAFGHFQSLCAALGFQRI